jgi:molecular chaperone GrpE
MSQFSDFGRGTEEPRPAGPVPGSGPSSSQAAGEDPNPAPPAGEADQAEGREVQEDLAELLADAQLKRDEYLDIARRTQADFENYRKRMAAEVQLASLRGKGQMARELIEAVDNLERALASAGEGSDGLAGGVEMVLRGMHEALKRNGVEAVDPKGEKFDPTQHEALSTMPVEGAEPGVVVEVMQKGYRLEDQLIRPARVVVSA